MSEPRVFEITLLIETDDEGTVETLAGEIGKLVCSHEDFETHVCPVPWFVLTSQVEGADADEARGLLNR